MKSGWFCATHQKRGQPLIPLQSCAAAPNEIEKTKTAAAAKLASPTSGIAAICLRAQLSNVQLSPTLASRANVHVIEPCGSPLPLQSLHFSTFTTRWSRILHEPTE